MIYVIAELRIRTGMVEKIFAAANKIVVATTVQIAVVQLLQPQALN